MALQASKPAGRPSSKSVERAKQLASRAIDGLVDPTAPAEEAAEPTEPVDPAEAEQPEADVDVADDAGEHRH